MRPIDFVAFHREIWQRDPFPWQARLVEEVLEGGWPDLLDLPTGTGKTTALDIGLFCLAMAPERFPRRMVLVVDRRVVVDQAHDRARKLQEAMSGAKQGVVAEVAARLRALWDGPPSAPPFRAAVLRGGMPQSDDWARRPDEPLIAASTVDQVGSRLLFRGYGVSRSMAPIHAGLLGNDTLFLLDEVHLAMPLAETLEALHTRWRRQHELQLPDRWGVVQMSATARPSKADARRFTLGAPDREHALLRKRLEGRKPARLVEVDVRGEEPARRRTLADRCVTEARKLLAEGARTVAIVVNRVDSARAASELLAQGKHVVEHVLLTGRMRPLDRDDALAKVRKRIEAGRVRSSTDEPLVVVATQCIEAGADFDFDGLVTECASLDALRQRFGRLDRLGELGTARAVIVARKDQIAADADDPIYGVALAHTWEWLRGHGDEVDFGITHAPDAPSPAIDRLIAPQESAPVLLPAHLDTWTQTSPAPWPEPDVAIWLHGPDRESAEVTVCWRADIAGKVLADLLAQPTGGASRPTPPAGGDLASLLAGLAACPPSSLETMSLPLGALRAWLSTAPDQVVPDVSDVAVPARRDATRTKETRPVLRWSGGEAEVIEAGAARPGDVLVIPAGYGGIRHGNWDPASDEPVRDLGEWAHVRARGRGALRLHPAVLEGLGLSPRLAAMPASWSEDGPDARTVADLAAEFLATIPAPPGSILATLRDELGTRPRVVVEQGTPIALIARRAARDGEVSSADDSASFIGRAVGLAEHCGDVKRWVTGFAARLGLPASLARDLGRAAWLHDVGKADRRFQLMLVGGSEVRLAGLDGPLAKSARPARHLRDREMARERAGYPVGYRHELLSLAMVSGTPGALDGVADPDLVLHLVASHHGHCRPFAPALDHERDEPVEVMHDGLPLQATTRHGLARLDSGVSDRFWTLVRRYGWWGLAWLEAILRLADHRASEEMETKA